MEKMSIKSNKEYLVNFLEIFWAFLRVFFILKFIERFGFEIHLLNTIFEKKFKINNQKKVILLLQMMTY